MHNCPVICGHQLTIDLSSHALTLGDLDDGKWCTCSPSTQKQKKPYFRFKQMKCSPNSSELSNKNSLPPTSFSFRFTGNNKDKRFRRQRKHANGINISPIPEQASARSAQKKKTQHSPCIRRHTSTPAQTNQCDYFANSTTIQRNRTPISPRI